MVEPLCTARDRRSDVAGAWLFGPAARADGWPDADINLLLVADKTVDSDDWAEAAARLANQVHAWTRNRAFFFSSRRRHTSYWRDWSSDVCSSDLNQRRSPASPTVTGGSGGGGSGGAGANSSGLAWTVQLRRHTPWPGRSRSRKRSTLSAKIGRASGRGGGWRSAVDATWN